MKKGNFLRIFIFLFLLVFVGQAFLSLGVLRGYEYRYFYEESDSPVSGSKSGATYIHKATYKFADSGWYNGCCGSSGLVSLENLTNGQKCYSNFTFGSGFYDLQMHTNVNDACAMGLGGDLHIYGTLSVPGEFFWFGSGNKSTIFFHKDDAIFLDSNDGLRFDGLLDGEYILDFMGHKFSCTGNNVLMHDSSNEVVVAIKNAIFEKDTTNWINLSAASNYTLSLESMIFNSDLYSGTFGSNTLIFKGLDNQFNVGLTLPVDVELGTKKQFSGVLDLNGYTLTLKSDIVFATDGSLIGNGTIETDGVDRTFHFNSDQTFGAVTIGSGGVITIDGGGYEFDFANGLNVSSGSLILENVKLQNFAANVTGIANITFGPDVLLIS